MKYKKVLVISPHTDDAELGAGGTIARLVDEGKEIQMLAFSGCEDSVPEGLPKDVLKKECRNSAEVMGIPPNNVTLLDYGVRTFDVHRQSILDYLVKLKNNFKPDLIIAPSSHDMHQDHATIYWETLRAFKKDSTIWGYEQPWNNLTFTTHIFVKLNMGHLERKIRALNEYKSQNFRSYMNEWCIRSIVYARGAQLDVPCAEAFELVRAMY